MRASSCGAAGAGSSVFKLLSYDELPRGDQITTALGDFIFKVFC